MGCNASKDGINGEGITSNYMTYHKPIHRRDSGNNLGRKAPTVSSSSLYPPRRSVRETRAAPSVQGHDREIQGKREHDRIHGSRGLGFAEMKKGSYPSLGGAPSFKDYLVSSINDDDDDNEEEEDTKMNESESEEKGRIETPDNYSAYASAEVSPILIEESVNKDDDIVGEACLFPPRNAMEKKSKLKERLYFKGVMTVEKLKNMLNASSWIPHNPKPMERD